MYYVKSVKFIIMIQYMKHVINVKISKQLTCHPYGVSVLLFILFATNMPPLRGFEGVW